MTLRGWTADGRPIDVVLHWTGELLEVRCPALPELHGLEIEGPNEEWAMKDAEPLVRARLRALRVSLES